MIRDRLVIGIHDHHLSERLQLDSELTLEKAKKAIRQHEAIQGQQNVLKGVTELPSSSLDRLQTGRDTRRKSDNFTGRKPPQEVTKKPPHQANQNPAKPCTRCGKGPHTRDKCLAKDVICYRCQRKGHFRSCCLTKSVSEMSQESDLDTAFLDTVTDQSTTSWLAQIGLNDTFTPFKLDTGAEVTATSTDTYQGLHNVKLHNPERILSGPSRKPLKVIRQFEGNFVYRTRNTSQSVFVVDGLKTNLLGLPTITALNLAVRVDTLTDVFEKDIPKQFPSLFQGLGNLGEEYNIQLKPEATPHTIFTPRHVPHTCPVLPQKSRLNPRMSQILRLSDMSLGLSYMYLFPTVYTSPGIL